MADICGAVLTAIYDRLSSLTIGFNPNYKAIQPNYYTRDGSYVDPIDIDFSRQSVNFRYGLVAPDLVEEVGVISYPLLSITADRLVSWPAGSNRRVHFQQYSGTVIAAIQMHLSWIAAGLVDFETWPNAVIDAMYTTMHAPSVSAPTVPNSWGSGVTFGYDLNCQKGPVLQAGENWRRTITFQGSFEVTIS